MLLKTKILIMAAVILLGTSSVALAATGQLPEAVSDAVNEFASLTGIRDSEPEEDGNGESGVAGDVTDIAKDEDATGTMTLPNGKEIENHGLAVSEIASNLREIGERYSDANKQRGEDQDQRAQPPANPGPGVEDGRQNEHIPEWMDNGAEYIPLTPGPDANQGAPDNVTSGPPTR